MPSPWAVRLRSHLYFLLVPDAFTIMKKIFEVTFSDGMKVKVTTTKDGLENVENVANIMHKILYPERWSPNKVSFIFVTEVKRI